VAFGQRSPLLVYGAGGHAKVVLATVEAEDRFEIVGLLDDDAARHGTMVAGYPVLGGREELARWSARGVREVIVAVGDNRRRAELCCLLRQNGLRLARAIHPTATVLRSARIGEGTVVLPNAFVGGDAVVGEGTIVSVGTVVGHDCVVGSWVHLCTTVTLGGAARVDDYAFVGMGAAVLPRVRVGCGVTVGANAAVNRDLPDGVIAAGVPARILKEAP